MPSTRHAIVTAAAALLDGGGPESITLRKVGHLAGVSHNAPYRHFKDREALLAAVAARELHRRSRAPQPKGRALERLDALTRDYVGWALRYPQRFKLVFGPWSEEYPELTEAAAELRERFVDTVIDAQTEKAIAPRPPERVVSLILALAHGAADLALGGHLTREGAAKASPDDLVDDLFMLLQATRKLR